MAKIKVTFYKFVTHEVKMTFDDAQALAHQIERGEFTPRNDYGQRTYRVGGWAFDVGRKPYLIQHAYGDIQRGWARSVKELRQALYLSRNDKVVSDPFFA